MPQSSQTKCNKHGHVILLLEVDACSLGMMCVLEGNHTEPLWWKTLTQAFQNDQIFITDAVQWDLLVSLVMPSNHAMSREILMSIFRIYTHFDLSIQCFFFILQFSEQCLERITKQQWSILTYTTTNKLFVCLFIYLFMLWFFKLF